MGESDEASLGLMDKPDDGTRLDGIDEGSAIGNAVGITNDVSTKPHKGMDAFKCMETLFCVANRLILPMYAGSDRASSKSVSNS